MGVWCILAYMFVCANVRLTIDTIHPLSLSIFETKSLTELVGPPIG